MYGGGYGCGNDIVSLLENSSNGLWNKVSYHVPWIKEIATSMGEHLENCAAPNVTGNECPFCGKNGTSGEIKVTFNFLSLYI